MSKYVKNTHATDIQNWTGQDVAAGEYFEIEQIKLQRWQVNSAFLVDLASGLAVMAKSDDGTEDIADYNDALNYLRNDLPTEVEFARKSPLTGRPEVVIVESEGDGETLPSHNFMNKTTWYQASTAVTGETPTLDTGKIYDLAQSDIIDNSHGKITFEDDLTDNDFKAYDGATELTIETDYTVDYDNGKITLDVGYTLS
ncbi:MAG: hypothetical protein DRR06_16575, partial [Gammaproteobacteria bacterium]